MNNSPRNRLLSDLEQAKRRYRGEGVPFEVIDVPMDREELPNGMPVEEGMVQLRALDPDEMLQEPDVGFYYDHTGRELCVHYG